jgi:hypothetical protein
MGLWYIRIWQGLCTTCRQLAVLLFFTGMVVVIMTNVLILFLMFVGHSGFGVNRSHRYNNRICVSIITTSHLKIEIERSAETLCIPNVPQIMYNV